MNKVYKVIWSHARKCYVVVSEIAKNYGKNNTKSIVSRLAARVQAITLRNAAEGQAFTVCGQPVARPCTAVRWIAPMVLAGILLQPVSGFASTITDKNGNNLIRRGNVQNLYVQTMLDDNNIGLNRFGEYKISAGDIANMHFNEQNGKVYANNLVNLVNSKIDINGTVNAVKNGKIDGNLYFISPDGMTVGPTGVINAGRVGVFIPNTSYWDELWKEDVNVKNNFADFENYGRRDENGQYKETRLAFADGKKIEIYGKINTRNGIVLGAQEILLKEGAVLKRSASTADVNFNDLVNIKDAAGTVTLSAGLDGELNAAVDGSTGDIILRAKSAHSYVNSFIPKETLESILHTEIQSKVEIGGSVNTDGPVDISAGSKTSFINLAYGGTSMLSDIGFNFLNDLGINMTASWVDKTNTATVALTDKGSIQAGGNVNLQTDAALDLRLKADVVKDKGQGTTTAIPVIAVGVMKLANSAVTDVKGGLQSNGNIRLAANADTTANLMANAVQNTLDNDPANSIYTGVAILTGNGLAEVNVAEGTAINAGGDFSASATGTNQTAVLATAQGKHETFTSTAVAVSDYDSAANVNLGRSVTAKSVTGEAVNDVKSLAILADNSNGDGAETYVEFKVEGGKSLAAKAAEKLKNKLGVTGFQNGGVLLPVENFLNAAKDYVTAGAGIAVVDHSNTANLTVARGVALRAAGDSAGNGGDVTLKSETVLSTLNQIVTGQLNQKADENGGSTVTVAAGVLVSNIENTAATEVLGGAGSTLTSENGNVTVTANTETNTNHVITTLHRSGEDIVVKDIEERFDAVINNLENVGRDASKLKDIKKDFQRTWGQMQGIKDGHVTTSFFDALLHNSLANLVFSEWRDYYRINASFKALVDSLLDYLSPAAYTSHYVRSYSVNRNQAGDTNMDLAASVNVGSLAGKAVVSLGEGVAVNAGKNITVDAGSVSDLASITGTGGEFLSYSETNGNGVGASIAVQKFTSDAIALVGKNVTLNAVNGTVETDGSNSNVPKSGTVSVGADSDAGQLALIFSAGKSERDGFSGSFNIQTGGSNSLVLVDDEAKITAANEVTVGSHNDYVMNNIVGGLAIGGAGSNGTVGAGLALNQLDVNSMAVMGDNGAGASTAATDTDTESFKKKSAEEQNEIKAENAVIAARKLAADRAKVKKMDRSFAETERNLTAALGNKTEGAAKGFVTGRNISVTAKNDGILNAIALEGADVSESHSVLDSINKVTRIASGAKEQTRQAIKNVTEWPADRLASLFTKSSREAFKTEASLGFGKYNPVNANGQNANASFNAEAAASFAWNNLDTQTAAIADNMTLNLRKQNSSEADGALVTAATDELFTGAWAGSGSVMWFTGAAQGMQGINNNAVKGALGTAVAVNKLDQKVNSLIMDSAITQAGSVLNKAVKNGSEVAAGLGVAVVNQTGGEGAGGSAAFGLSLNMVENDIHAILIDSSATYEKDDITYTGGTSLENRAHDGDIQVAGGANMAWISTGGSGIAAGITAAASDLKNDIQSGIQGGSYSGLSNLSVKAGNTLTQVNAGVGLGVARSGGRFSIGGAGTLALNELENTSRAFIADTESLTASGNVTVMARDVASSPEEDNLYKEYLGDRKVDSGGLSYLGESVRDAVGTGAGNTIVNVAIDVAESKGVSAGAAVSVNQVVNRISADITGNKQMEAASVNGEADVHSDIVSLATGVSVSESSFGGAASVSWNDLQQDNIVSVTGNRGSGNAANDGIKADSVTGTAKNTSHIVNVTGEFAGGQNSVGLSVAVNRMEDISGIYFAKNRIGERVANEGTAVSLNADNNASALAIGVGVDANYKENGTAAAYGNFVANRGHNDTIAVIGEDKGGNKASGADRDRIDNAASVEVRATDDTQRTTVAGSAQLALQRAKAALGAGVALTGSDAGTESGDGRETLRAEIINTDITTVKKNGTDAAVTVSSADKSKATTAIVGVGITTKSTVAAQGLGADAKIYKNNTAGLNDTTIDATGGCKTALVSVKADTSSAVKTGAAALQLSGPDSFLAGVVAVGVNRIKDNTEAGVSYTTKPNAESLNAGNLDISAVSNGEITSVAMGASVAVKGTAAVGGSGSHNFIENSAAAKIENANIYSAGNVGVVARSDEAITNYAGVIDVAVAGGQGVSAALGVTGSNNKISGNTEAQIRNSKVVAKGSDSNKIKTNSKLKTDDTYLINGAVTFNTWSAGKLQKGREEEEKTGVVVDASATHAIASVLANGGVAVGSGDSGAGASLAGVINLNDVGGSTTAKVVDSQLNEEASDKRSSVNVHAADYTNVAEFSGAAAVGIGEKAGIAAGFTGTTNEISRATEALVSTASAAWDKNTNQYKAGTTDKTNRIFAKDFAVTADAKQAMSAFNVTGAIAGSSGVAFETGDNVNTNRMMSSTVAAVTNTAADYKKDATVEASHADAIYNLNVDVGAAIAPSQKGVAGSLNVGVGVVQEGSVVAANVVNSEVKNSNASSDPKSSLSVGAANATTLETRLVSAGVAAGAFSGGIASSIAVNNINTKVTGSIVGSQLAADTINVSTTNALAVHDAVGTGAGALEVGIGVGVDVNTFNDSVSTIIDNSSVKATDTLSINTKTQRETDSTVAGVGIGALSVAVNVLSVTVNDGIGNLEDVKDDEAGNSFSHSAMLNEAVQKVNDKTGRVLADKVAGMTDAEKQAMQNKSSTGADTGNNVNGAGVHTYVRGSSALEAVNGALTVNNTERNDADLNGGSGSLGVIAVNVADVVYHQNQLNNVLVDSSSVKGGSVSMTAQQGNVTRDDDKAIHASTVQAQAGVAGIGVGYSGITTKGNTGVTLNKSTVSAADGDLSVQVSDTTRSTGDMLGVSAGLLTVPVSVTRNTNKANTFINVEGGSSLSAMKLQETRDSKGNKITESVPGNAISLQIDRSGKLVTDSYGVGAGGVNVAVNTAKSMDFGSSVVQVKGSGNTFSGGGITLEAVNAPTLKAEAGGVDVGLIGVAVNYSKSRAESTASVIVADGNSLLGDAVIARAVVGREGSDMAYAKTNSTNVSVGVGVDPDGAEAETATEARVSMGLETYKTVEENVTAKDASGNTTVSKVTKGATNLSLMTENNASRNARLGNTTVGLLVSVTDGDALGRGEDRSTVEAKGAAGGDGVKLKNLKINAGGYNISKGLGDGGSGGIFDISPTVIANMESKTINTASLSGAWDVDESANISALQYVTSKGSTKTGAGGVISVTWANAKNYTVMNTRTELKEGARLTAGQAYLQAGNKVITDAYDGETWANTMSIGGVINVASGDGGGVESKQTVEANAVVDVGKNVRVTTSKGQVYNAYADLDITNKVKGKGGGVGENMDIYSVNNITPNNKVIVGQGAELEQKGEFENGNDITLSSTDRIRMNLAAEGSVYGLEGVLKAKVKDNLTRHNTVEVNGALASTHDINLYSGVNADGTDAEVKIDALAEGHNDTLLSFYTSPEVKLNLQNNQQVKVSETGSAVSKRHINVTADNGSEAFKKEVVEVVNLFAGSDRSTKTVTNQHGNSEIEEENNNFVNVEGLLRTGTQSNVQIDIRGALLPAVYESGTDANGNKVETLHILEPADSRIKTFEDVEVYVNKKKIERGNTDDDIIVKPENIVIGDMDYAAKLGNQLDTLNNLIAEYSNGKSDNTAAYLGYVQQRQRILEEMDARGMYIDETDESGKMVRTYLNKDYNIRYVEIPDITVSGGNITVRSGNLYGKGRLEANGAPQIIINNLSNAYLKLNNMSVGDEGGQIRFQGNSVSSGDKGREEINNLNWDKNKKAQFNPLYNDSTVDAVSAISVLNDCSDISTDPQNKLTVRDQNGKTMDYVFVPDVNVAGDIRNRFGDVVIVNKQGNITIGSGNEDNKANVGGRSVQLDAAGSISQDYIDGAVSIGGNPEDLNDAEAVNAINSSGLSKTDNDKKYPGNLAVTESKAESGRIAGDSIYLAAADININGLIQSGYGRYEAVIDKDALSDENLQKLKNNGSEVTVSGRTMYKVNDGNRGVYDAATDSYKFVPQVYYDPRARELVVDDIGTRGGKIYLTGRISSTGNGRVLAADGAADIYIENNTTANLTVGQIVNSVLEGKIEITDLANDTWTQYTRSGTYTISDYTSHLKETNLDQYKTVSEAIGYYNKDNPKTYKVLSGLRYNWTLGQTTTTVQEYEEVTKKSWWGLDSSTSTDMESHETASNLQKETSYKGQGLTDGVFIDNTTINNYANLSEMGRFGGILENNVTDNAREETGDWEEGGHWYKLWSDPKHHTTWRTTTGATQTYTFSLEADKAFAVGFLGSKDGSINVLNMNPDGGSINLSGNIQSATGYAGLSIFSAGGGVSQKAGTFLTTGKAGLSAKNSIENIQIASMGERIATGQKDDTGKEIYSTKDGVLLTAVSAGGNIDVTVTGGSVDGQVLPGNAVIENLLSFDFSADRPGSVSLQAAGNITQADTVTGAAVTGRNIRLTSLNGSIGILDGDGTSGQPVVVESFSEKLARTDESTGVSAEAKKNIYLAEKADGNIAKNSGNMRVGTIISHEGDVCLEAKNGRLVDALPPEANGNNMSEADVIRHWIDAGLIAGTKEYEGAYIRGLKKDAADFEKTVRDQYALCQSGKAGDQIKEIYMTRTEKTEADGTVTAAWTFKYASADEYLKALLNDTSAEGNYYKNTVKAYTDPVYSWTREELLYAIGNAIVNKETGVSAETQNKKANIQGRNVTLAARGIGISEDRKTVIKVSELYDGSDEAIEKMQMLANVDAADVTLRDAKGNRLVRATVKKTLADGRVVDTLGWKVYDEKGNELETDGVLYSFEIGNLSPLGVYATGRVDAAASGDNAFIAGRSNEDSGFVPINIGQISAAGGKDVRLYTQEGIYHAVLDGTEPAARIRSRNLIAYGGARDIGKADDPLTVSLSGDLLGAYADGSIYIKNTRTDNKLRLGSVFANNTIYLESDKGFGMTADTDYQLAYVNAGKTLELKTNETEGEIGEEVNPVRILNNGVIIDLNAKNAYVKGVKGVQGDATVMKLGVINMAGSFGAVSEGFLEVGVTRPEEKDENGKVIRNAVQGKVKAGEKVKLEAVNDLTLAGPASAGTVSRDEKGKYTGGGKIDLVSAKGRILQNADGALVAGSVTATSGKGVTLTDAGNTFREFTAYGVDTEVTDAQGSKITEKAIDGSINVRTHAGSMLAAGIAGTVVYGDVAMTNLDDGGLTVDTDIVTKKGIHGEAGNITFSQQGDILVSKNASLQAGGSVFAASSDGAVSILGKVEAARDIDVKTGSGKLRMYGDVHAGNDILAATESGFIEMDNGVAAQHDIVATSRSGNIGLMGDIYAGNDVNAQTGGTGKILFNLNFLTGRHEVRAGRDVNLTVEDSAIMIAGKVTTDTGDVRATAKTGGMIFSGSVQAGNDIIASVTGDGVIQYSGTVNAARDIIATTASGNINYDKHVEAGRSVMALTDKGDVTYNASVVAEDSVLADVLEGDVTVNHDIVARQGYVTLTLADGSATVGKADGTGKIKAGNDVSITTSKGDATVKTSITSDNGSVSVSSEQGNINVGEVAVENAISARENIDLFVANGVITINGHTMTQEGDITVHAIDFDDDNNIVITENGKLISARDLTLHTYNGGIEVTDDTIANRNLNILVDNKGGIELGRDVVVGGDVAVKTGSGDITMGKRGAAGVEVHTVTSTGGSINIETGKGNISIGHNAANDPTIVAEQNVTLYAKEGIITVDGKTETKQGDITVHAHNEDPAAGDNIVILHNGILDSGRDLTLHTYNGGIEVTDSTLAKRNIKIIVDNQGDITFGRDINVVGDVSVETGNGNISVAKKVKSQQGSVDILTKKGNILIGDNGPDVETVAAYKDVSLQAESGKIEVYGKTCAQTGDVTLLAGNDAYIAGEAGKNIIIDHNGEVEAGRDATMIVVNGDIHVTDKITAGRSYNTETREKGSIYVDKDITVGQDTSMKTENGGINVGEDINAGRNITMTTGTGDIRVGGSNGKGNVVAGNHVALTVTSGSVSVDKTVKARGGNVDVLVKDGDIQIGNNGPDVETVAAGGNVNLTAESGKIRISGKTATETGDITVHAANDNYVEGENGQNIIFDQNGKLAAGRDATLIMTNGDLHVTDHVTAGRNLNAETRGRGNISLDDDVTVNKDMSMKTETGNINVGKTITAKDGTVNMTTAVQGDIAVGADVIAGKDINMDIKSGNILVGENGKGNVVASDNVKMTVASGNVSVEKTVKAKTGNMDVLAENGNIKIGDNGATVETVAAGNNVNLTSQNGMIEIYGKTASETGDVNVTVVNAAYGQNGQNIKFDQHGLIAAGRDANLIVENGDLHVTNDVIAQRSFNVRTRKQGNIMLDENVTAVKDMSMKTETGDINVGKTITAKDGTVSMSTAVKGDIHIGADVAAGRDVNMDIKSGSVSVDKDVTAGNDVNMAVTAGNISVGSNGTGSVIAENNVKMTVNSGDISVEKAVKAKNGSVDVLAEHGSITIGNNKDADTVSAGQNVNLTARSGQIRILGKTSTESGNINVTAINETYNGNGKSIIFDENGKLAAGRDANLVVENGDLHITDDVTAGNNFNAQTRKRGNIMLDENIRVQHNISMQTDVGDITVGRDIVAGNDVKMTVGDGKVTVGEVDGKGNGSGNITAGGNVGILMHKGDVHVVKSVKSDGGSVDILTKKGDIRIGDNKNNDTVSAYGNVKLTAENGKIEILGGTCTQTGDIAVYAANDQYVAGENGLNIIFDQNGRIASGHDATLVTENGDMHVTGRVSAENNLTFEVRKRGHIMLDDNIDVKKNLSMKTEDGNITVDKTITAVNGTVAMTVGTGFIQVKQDINAAENVEMSVEKGLIIVGRDGVGRVTAGNDVTMETREGKIEIYDRISAGRDVSVKAADTVYMQGTTGHNIIIGPNGQIASGRDAKLESTNGDIHVTDKITAGHSISAITHGQGDIFLRRDVDASRDLKYKATDGSVILRAEDKGNISVIDPDTQQIYKITAGDRIDVYTGDGNITVGEAEAKRMSLVARGGDGHVTADRLLVHADGTGDVTGAANLTLGGSQVNVTGIENDGAAPLIISTVGGAAEDRPMQDFNIGIRNGDGGYTGGIQSGSGAVLQQLWADNAMLYLAGGTNLHISKLAVNEKLHVANDIVSVAVFGVPPTHDGERVVYWNDIYRNNPAGMTDRWYSGSYSDPAWMNLDLLGNGSVGSHYGVLMDAHYYRNLYGDSVSMVDTMRIRMEPIPAGNGIYYFDRNNLIEIDDSGLYSDDTETFS